jgi:molybdopterin synthase sulfur carrier subunit
MIQVLLPTHLRELAQTDRCVWILVKPPFTYATLLDALEARYPALCGTIRDHQTRQRRPLVRFFACGQDVSMDSMETLLPDAVVGGSEPFIILGAIAGGV